MLRLLGTAVRATLTALSLRRITLVGAALASPRAIARFGPQPLPAVTLVVPALDEARGIDGLLTALERLDYPSERLFHVSIAVIMGLNVFFWSFASSYPALLYVAHHVDRLWQ